MGEMFLEFVGVGACFMSELSVFFWLTKLNLDHLALIEFI